MSQVKREPAKDEEQPATDQPDDTVEEQNEGEEPPSKGALDDDERPARSKWRRRLGIAALSLPVLLLAGWLAVHNIPGFGPFVADSLRAVFGKAFVAWLEDTAYGIEDWILRKTKGDAPPEEMWDVPESATAVVATPAPTTSASAGPPPKPDFALPNLEPMHENLATKGDGVWLPYRDPRKPDDRVRMLKTFLHPDKQRSWAIVAVIAIDLSAVELHAVAGKYEPKSVGPEAKAYERPAKIPESEFDALIAAFNGGYKSTHGDYGMKVDGVLLQPPRALCCVVAKLKDGTYLIRNWDDVKDRDAEMVWWRQTPICMYDQGEPHPALGMPSMGWGASSVSKTTVIRRSAIGLNAERTVAYVAIGNHVTGQAIGEALHHAGSDSVAQLDVNFSYPKFFTYEDAPEGDERELVPIPLTENFEFTDGQYVHDKSQRDFFYLTRKED